MDTNNEKHIIIAGFGGQGVLFAGTVLAQAAMLDGKNTTWIPSYGAEMRGGSANCFVVISDGEISSPLFDEADYGIFLSKAAINRFEKAVAKEGLAIINSTIEDYTAKRNDINHIIEPFTDLASKTNEKRFLNIMALGLMIEQTQVLSKQSVIDALKKISSAKKPEFLDHNLKSFEEGYNLRKRLELC